ncbi:hypothetical protein K505DRAFT_376341 [Melanomma pulvis-pyrius CBS 109.77]|uniref:WD40 repeat-like protein n=1 Tax=Melanomma pulvis-pyrius CBS 109.77 TaxID=1314802 RepID=A0A6A6X7Y0_9PLEO|nr:hypothetical protein K505DRAFT_376341 [Melanomma pulvis-pyrius CBS 109.77]
MAQREIPGFYFDSEKKKYFKIQQSQHAPPPESKYSHDNIAKEKKKEEEETIHAKHWKQRRRQTIIRSSARNLLSQASLDREIGHRRGSSYVRNVWPGAIASGFQFRTIVSDWSVSHFDRDPIRKTLYIVKGEASIQCRRPNGNPRIPISSRHEDDEELLSPLNTYTFQPWDTLARLTSSVSSLNYLPGSGALCATTFGMSRPPVIYLTDPNSDVPGEVYSPRNCNTVWGSAPRPLSFPPLSSTNSIPATSTEYVAVGASSAPMLFTRGDSGTWTHKTILNLSSDIFALEWLSENTLALGCRNGKIHIYDIRANGESHILTHPFPISQLRRGDDFTRLVCSGLQNTCVLYDMRMGRRSAAAPRRPPPQQETKRLIRNLKRKRSHLPYSQPRFTQPVLHFRHSNTDDLELGIDVHPGLGLVAAAQEDASIRVSNLWTGKTVRVFGAVDDNIDRQTQGWKKPDRIRCLRFINDGDGDGEVGLWSAGAAGLRRFAW